MAAHDNDPPEFIGSDRAVKADHIPSRAPRVAVAPPPLAAPVATYMDAPQPTAEHRPAEKQPSHLTHAVVRPRKNWEAAQSETVAARSELVAATSELKIAEHAYGDALADWLALNKPPTQEEVYREHVARSQADRAAAVVAGRNPDATVAAPVINKSPIDQFALARGKGARGTPLRSNVVRR
jgi:hypothetical protein